MKIEKVNDNQIRCTLTKEDLASRKIKLSELAYGTEKAKSLFRDMMQQANRDFGFEAEDIPLMIEAIPLNADCIVLVITKVEDPEELDTRFSRFAPDLEDAVDDETGKKMPQAPLDLSHKAVENTSILPGKENSKAPATASRVFLFSSLERVLEVAGLVHGEYSGTSILYKGFVENEYLLLLENRATEAATFDKICNLVSEYASFCRAPKYEPSFLAEHCEVLSGRFALNSLGELLQ